MVSGTLIVVVAFFIPTRRVFVEAIGAITLFFLLIELVRLCSQRANRAVLDFFKPIVRVGEESRLSGSSYYLIGCTISAIVFPKEIALLAILYLAFGDPVASLVGLLFGKRRKNSPLKDFYPKSLEGSIACFLVCFLLTVFVSFVLSRTKELNLGERLAFAGLGGLAGSIGELIPFHTDDNLALPLVSGALLWLSASIFNLIPGLYLQ